MKLEYVLAIVLLILQTVSCNLVRYFETMYELLINLFLSNVFFREKGPTFLTEIDYPKDREQGFPARQSKNI